MEFDLKNRTCVDKYFFEIYRLMALFVPSIRENTTNFFSNQK